MVLVVWHVKLKRVLRKYRIFSFIAIYIAASFLLYNVCESFLELFINMHLDLFSFFIHLLESHICKVGQTLG